MKKKNKEMLKSIDEMGLYVFILLVAVMSGLGIFWLSFLGHRDIYEAILFSLLFSSLISAILTDKLLKGCEKNEQRKIGRN